MNNMLRAHLAAIENNLLAQSKIASNTGHPLHKGTPREIFVRNFLSEHLPETLSIGSGEIISYDSSPGESRNQFDIILYKKNFPKLSFGGGINGYLIESVVATIEVKSTLTEQGLEQAMKAANKVKNMKKSLQKVVTSGYIPTSILSIVIAYDGPENMKTIYDWKGSITRRNNIPVVNLPRHRPERLKVASSSIDNVFILGKGLFGFDNSLLEIGGFPDDFDSFNWWFAQTNKDVLLYFFFVLASTCNNMDISLLEPAPYFNIDETFMVGRGM